MKHSSFRLVCLVLLVGTALAAFGDDLTVSLESRVLETFDNAENALYVWHSDASRYAVGKDPADKDNPLYASLQLKEGEFFPRLNHFDIWPMALFRGNRDNKQLKSLGIWGKFKRVGYNWIDIYPTLKSEGNDAKPYEIPIPGRARFLDMWVWSPNTNYYMEAYLRDEQGSIHTVYMGTLNYYGWRNIRAAVPTSIPQRKRIILETNSINTLPVEDRNSVFLTFVKFRIWTTPREAVNNFYIYFDQFKVLTDTFVTLYDGDELTDPDWIRENWGTNK